MSAARKLTPDSHVVDILGSTRGRDQPIMLMEKALELVSNLSSEICLDPKTVLFNPFCKAGEILLASALHICNTRAKQLKIDFNQNDVINELYNGRFFGLAPDERHFHLTKRTFLGNDRSHKYDRIY